MEKPLRFDRMSGLDSGQLDELVLRVAEMLEIPWKCNRPARELTLREAIIIASGYTRQNIIQDVWAGIFDISQPGVSRIITVDASTATGGQPLSQDPPGWQLGFLDARHRASSTSSRADIA